MFKIVRCVLVGYLGVPVCTYFLKLCCIGYVRVSYEMRNTIHFAVDSSSCSWNRRRKKYFFHWLHSLFTLCIYVHVQVELEFDILLFLLFWIFWIRVATKLHGIDKCDEQQVQFCSTILKWWKWLFECLWRKINSFQHSCMDP